MVFLSYVVFEGGSPLTSECCTSRASLVLYGHQTKFTRRYKILSGFQERNTGIPQTWGSLNSSARYSIEVRLSCFRLSRSVTATLSSPTRRVLLRVDARPIPAACILRSITFSVTVCASRRPVCTYLCVFQFLMKYLATFDGASTAELVEVKAAAVKGCIGAVKAPIVSFTEQVQKKSCSV